MTKFICDLDLWTPKCIGIFLSPSCIYVQDMKAFRWKLLKLLCQNQSFDQVQLWPWPFDLKIHKYLPITILHLCTIYESCTLKTTQVIVSDPKFWRLWPWPLTFWPQCIGIPPHHPASIYEILKLRVCSEYTKRRVNMKTASNLFIQIYSLLNLYKHKVVCK